MAEMLVDGAKLDACNTAEADAIRAKTGGSSPIPYDYANNKGFADAIAAIPSGGGGLPTGISAIDAGEFTVASNTLCESYNIPTQLGIPAKGFVIFSDDLTNFEVQTVKGLLSCSVNIFNFESASGANRYGYYSYIQRQVNGNTYGGVTFMSYSNQPEKFANGERIRYAVSDTYYIANKKYKWFAWA
jgi:hypothetical protein